uniref:Uncharacterized protein n=1 Tax=Acanthochromis polyacanthus TaxID=80966 RepID=A0A3Q1GSI4_9TELE
MTPSVVLLIVLHLCSLQLMAVAMPRCWLPGKVVQETHHLLRDMGTRFPVQCLVYNSNISFPDSALPSTPANRTQCRQVSWVVYESLREAGLLFGEYDLPAGEGGVNWDEQKFDDFLNLQDRLVEQDGRCLSRVNSSVDLSSYFSNVTAVIQQPDSAACGWQALRRDLIWVLKSALQRHHNCFGWSQAH